MGVAYFYQHDGKQFGPVSPEQLKEIAASGQLESLDLIRKDGTEDWVPAARFKGLIPPPPDADDSEYNVAPPPPRPEPPPMPAVPVSAVEHEEAHDTTQADIMARQAKDATLAASTDALKAFKVLAKNPVGGMREAFADLGPNRAMAVGIVFALVFYVCVVIGFHLVGRGSMISLLLLGIVPPVAAIAGCAGVRKMFRGDVNLQCDTFIGGASLLPYGVGVLLVGLLASTSPVANNAIGIFASTTTVLMLYSGCTSLQGIPEAAATLAVPLIAFAGMIVERFIW